MEEKRKRLNRPYAGRRSMQENPADSDKKKEIAVVCQQIKYYREKLGMEQKELASKIGIQSNAISNWENGRARPDLALLPGISQLLGVSIDELFGLPAPEPERIVTVEKEKQDPEDESLLKKYHQLSAGHRMVVDAMLDKLSEVEDLELYDKIIETTLFSKQLAAGYDPGLEFDDDGEVIHLYRTRETEAADCVFTVSGDSMEPEFHDGDKVLVKRNIGYSELKPGEIGAFIVGNETYIKVYRKDGLHSLNKKYRTMKFSEDDSVFLIGKVRGVLEPDCIVPYDEVERFESVRQRIEESQNS
ncbi:MAG: helix-turn-helix domain-containing protein [Alistipes sp.]|nr:helix-turn-helix domain-containing protein [Alistipes sp.]